MISGQATQINVPVSVSAMCSAPSAVNPEIRMTAAEATTKVMPITASWGTTVSSRRLNEKMSAPTRVKPTEKARAIGVSCSTPNKKPTVAPSAAICAKARSTKMTPRGDDVEAQVRVDREDHKASHDRRDHEIEHVQAPGAANA